MNTIRSFQNYHPVDIRFEPDKLPDFEQLIQQKEPTASTLCIVSRSVYQVFQARFAALPHQMTLYTGVKSNPDWRQIDAIPIPKQCCRILGIGGGSVLDTAKACFARLITGNQHSLETLIQTPAKFESAKTTRYQYQLVLIPSTFGSSSELTPWGTMWDWQAKRKYSINHALLYADQAWIHPALSRFLPHEITAFTGLDVLSHAIESFWSKTANPISRLYALEAMKRCVHVLPRLLEDLDNMAYRGQLALAALLAGKAFSQTMTAAAHALSYPLTLHHGMPHGFACSITLGAIYSYNEAVEPELMQPIRTLFQNMLQEKTSSFTELFQTFLKKCHVRSQLREYGVSIKDIPHLTANVFHPDRFNNMISPLSEKDVVSIFMSVL